MNLWLLLAASLALRGAPAPERFEDAGTFIARGWEMSSMVGPGPDGSERLYVCYTYNDSMDLVAFEPGSTRFRVWPNSEGGAWAMETGSDGRIYLGTYDHGHILRLDPQSGKLDDLGEAVPGEKGIHIIWQLSAGPDGMLYGCAFPKSRLIRVQPATGKIENLGPADPTQEYNRSLCAAPDGWVYCGVGAAKAGLVAYNPATGERRSLIPEAERKPGFGQVVRGADGNAYGSCADVAYRLHDGAATRIDKLPAAKPRTRLKDARETFPDLAYRSAYKGREVTLFDVGTGPDDKVYATTLTPEYLLRYDPATQTRTTIGRIPGAEGYSMQAAQGKLFIGSYNGATLQIYDPTRPLKGWQSRDGNPRYFGTVAPKQQHPFDMALAPDGKVYIACMPLPGEFGGALAWYDPSKDAVDHVPTPVADQGISSVCVLPDGRLACGTSAYGGAGTTPRAREGVLFLWDPQSRKKVYEGAPVPGALVVGNLALGGDGLIYGSAGTAGTQEQHLFAFDPVRQRVVGRTDLSQGTIARQGLLALPDGRVAALAGSSAVLIRWDGSRWQTREVARWNTPLWVGKAALDGWLYAATSDKHLVRCRIPQRD